MNHGVYIRSDLLLTITDTIQSSTAHLDLNSKNNLGCSAL